MLVLTEPVTSGSQCKSEISLLEVTRPHMFTHWTTYVWIKTCVCEYNTAEKQCGLHLFSINNKDMFMYEVY